MKQVLNILVFGDLINHRTPVRFSSTIGNTYAYDDLVFPDNGVFIVQFGEQNNNNLFCYFQEDCNLADRQNIFTSLTSECVQKKCSIELKGGYTLEQDGENIQIKFS